jgi:hypothetical protein
MSLKSKLIALGVSVLLITGAAVIYPSSAIEVTIDPNSEIQEGISVTVIGARQTLEKTAPFIAKIRPGKYVVVARFGASHPWQEEVIVRFGQKASVKVALTASTAEPVAEEESNPDAVNDFSGLFPYEADSFRAEASFIAGSDNQITLEKISITLFLKLPSSEPANLHQLERSEAVEDVERWMLVNNFPSTVIVEYVN